MNSTAIQSQPIKANVINQMQIIFTRVLNNRQLQEPFSLTHLVLFSLSSEKSPKVHVTAK